MAKAIGFGKFRGTTRCSVDWVSFLSEGFCLTWGLHEEGNPPHGPAMTAVSQLRRLLQRIDFRANGLYPVCFQHINSLFGFIHTNDHNGVAALTSSKKGVEIEDINAGCL